MSLNLHSCPALHVVSHTSHSSLHFAHMSRTSVSSSALYAHVLQFCRVLYTLACSYLALCAGVLHLLLAFRISPNCQDFSLVSTVYCSCPVLRDSFLYFTHILHFPFVPSSAHAPYFALVRRALLRRVSVFVLAAF